MNLQAFNNLMHALKDIGLSANEINTYINLLTIGSNPASVIARKTRINRSTCYETLKKLMREGFARQLIKKHITYYEAVKPKIILERLQQKQLDIKHKIDNLNHSLAQFELIKQENNHKPKVVFFDEVEGLKNIMEDTLTSSEPLRAYASLGELTALFPNYWPDYYKRRSQKGIYVRAIYPADEISYNHQLRDQKELRESRLVPKEFDFHLDLLIYDNKVAIISLSEKFGVLIESYEMATAQKRIFDIIWAATKIYKTGIVNQLEPKSNNNSSTEESGVPKGSPFF